MKGIRSLLNNILNAGRFGEQVDAIKLLESGVEQYANQSVIEELEKQVQEYFKQQVEIDLSKRLIDRIEELKQEI